MREARGTFRPSVCRRKTDSGCVFATFEEADRERRRLLRRCAGQPRLLELLQAYLCHVCGRWHVGKNL